MISTHSRSSQLRTARFGALRQGFSLIEVAIALVIFVIGALAIIRIFPGALSVIGNNGDQQIATNLNSSALARLKSEKSVPDTTFNLGVNSTNNTILWTVNSANHSDDYRDVNAAVLGVPRFNNSLPAPEDINTGANSSALSRFRGVQGEMAQSFKIGAGDYALTQFPVSIQEVGGVQTPLAPTVSQDLIVQNVRISNTGVLDFTNAIKEDGTPLATATPLVVVNAGSLFYVNYRYWDDVTDHNNRRVWGISEEPVRVISAIPNLAAASSQVAPPTVNTRGKFLPYNPNPSDMQPQKTGVVPQLISVRVRNFLGQGSFDGANAFERVADARRGLVRLPTLPVGAGSQVAIDYVADWSMLLQDGIPLLAAAPAATPRPNLTAPQEYRQLALGAPFIEDKIEVGIYSLLLDPSTPNTAYRSAYGTDTNATNPLPAGRLVVPTEDELRAGKVTFAVDNSATRARVAYRTRDSWVQQLTVAAKSYKPFSSGRSPGAFDLEKWRDYYVGSDNYLYFHAGEAGKTINLSYSYNDVKATGTPDPLDDIVIVDRPHAIDNQLLTAPSDVVASGFVNADDLVARVKLQTAKGEDFPATKNTATINLTSIQAVKGVSVTVRTAYINGTKYAQKIDTTTRGANS